MRVEQKYRLIMNAAAAFLSVFLACDMEPPRGNIYDPANDTVYPRVVATVPPGEERGVPLGQVISATFSETINELSVDQTSFVVLDRKGDYVYGKITCVGNTITFKPHVDLDSAQDYRVVITTAVSDLALNPMAAQFEWQFRTAARFAPDMVTLPGDTYTRGSDLIAGTDDTVEEYLNGPEHQVTVSSFEIGRYEVTVEEYAEYCRAIGIPTPAAPFGGGRMPVVNVSWYDAIWYCNWLSDIMGYTPCYTTDDNINFVCDFNANGFRLPTEGEWEFAARNRGTTPAEEYSGYAADRVKELYMIYRENSRGGTEIVDNIEPNDLGLYHMSGNVREWCWDFSEVWIWLFDRDSSGQINELEGTFYYEICKLSEPVNNPAGYERKSYWPLAFSMRGGSWSDSWSDTYYPASPLWTAVRSDKNRSTIDLPTRRRDNLGFRLCRTHVE